MITARKKYDHCKVTYLVHSKNRYTWDMALCRCCSNAREITYDWKEWEKILSKREPCDCCEISPEEKKLFKAE
jgi:hypothetical protein